MLAADRPELSLLIAKLAAPDIAIELDAMAATEAGLADLHRRVMAALRIDRPES